MSAVADVGDRADDEKCGEAIESEDFAGDEDGGPKRVACACEHGGKAEVDAFFRQYDEYRQKDAKVKQLENQVSSLTRDYKELSSDYEKLRQTANSYAKEYNRMSVELAASKSTKKVKPLPEVPERKPKPAFNTIRSKDER